MIRIPRRNPEINADFSPRRRLTGGGIRLNFSDADRALSDLNRAVGQGPRYVQEDVSSGVQAIAKGAQQATKALQELQVRNQDITDKRKLYDGETKLAILQQDLQGKLTQEKDPNKWESLAAEHMAAAEFDTEGMSPSAVEALQQYAERTKALTVARARNGGFVENERKYLESATARLQIAEDARDIAGVVRIANEVGDSLGQPPEVVAANIIPRSRNIQAAEIRDLDVQVDNLLEQNKPEEAKEIIENHHFLSNDPLLQAEKERRLLKIDAKILDNNFNNAISVNPTAELEELDKPDGKYSSLPEYKKQDMRLKAAQMRDNKSILTSKRVTDRMAEGTITYPEQLDTPEFKDLTPTIKQSLKQTILEGAPNNNKEWLSVMNELNAWKASPDTYQDDIDLNSIEDMVGVRFKGASKDQLVKRIQEIRSGPDAAKTSAAKKYISELFTSGGLGVTKVPYVKKREAGMFGLITAEEGTALSPADQVRTGTDVAKEDRIEPKDLVTDVRKQAAAQKKMMELIEGVERLAAEGKGTEEQLEFVKTEAAQYLILPALENKEKAITPLQQQPLYNSLPNVNQYMQQRASSFGRDTDTTKIEMPKGTSPESNSPNPFLPPAQ
jgi:hypothetical protein